MVTALIAPFLVAFVSRWQAKQGITKEAEDAYFDGNLPSTTPVASISVEADAERVGVSVGDAR